MKSTFFLAVFSLLFFGGCKSKNKHTTYYISLSGNDCNNGLGSSKHKALKNIDYALQLANPGDSLIVCDGEYETDGIYINDIHGLPDKPIIIVSKNKHGAVLSRTKNADPDKSVVVFSKSSYIKLESFEVYDYYGNESGIDVRDSSHHITIKDCYIHDCACGGISSRMSDYLVFDGNIVRDNSKRNMWNCSGISIWHAIEYDQEPGHHIQIINNVSFNNECDIPFNIPGDDRFNNPTPTDGNGIIIDDFRNTQGGGQEQGYKARVLVANNLSFNNGGRGINIYESDNVDVLNNTCYYNLRVLSKYLDFPGDVTISNSNSCNIEFNLIAQNPTYATKALRCYDNDSTNTTIKNNFILGSVDFCGQNLSDSNNSKLKADNKNPVIFKNPKLENNFNNKTNFNEYFGLHSDSPVQNRGVNFWGIKHNFKKPNDNIIN